MSEPTLWGPNGSLARFTKAANGIHDIAERCREQMDPARARIVREALRSLSNEPGCGDLFTFLASGASDAALAKLGRLLK